MWNLQRVEGRVQELHAVESQFPDGRTVRICQPLDSALVLGSAQREETIDGLRAAALGLEVMHRRSGGGAVLVTPDNMTWIDLFVPAGDSLWVPDVGKAFEWLGDSWAQALGRLGVVELDVHRGALVASEWSRVICFAGLGPGEVLSAGKKVVGISQRRTRDGARFQCALHHHWDPTLMASLLADRGQHEPLATYLAQTCDSVPLAHEALIESFVSCLPA